MAGVDPGLFAKKPAHCYIFMAGLVPAIHVFLCFYVVKTWMPGTRLHKAGYDELSDRCIYCLHFGSDSQHARKRPGKGVSVARPSRRT